MFTPVKVATSKPRKDVTTMKHVGWSFTDPGERECP